MRKALASLVLLAVACSSDPRVGVYSVDRITAESKVAKEMLAAAARTPKKDEAERAVAEFKAVEKTPLSAAELQRRRGQTQQLIDAANEEIDRAHAEATQKLAGRLAAIAARLAIARRMQLVIAISGRPAYSDPGCDLTAEMIANLDGLTSEVARARAVAAAAHEHAKQLDDQAAAELAAEIAATSATRAVQQ